MSSIVSSIKSQLKRCSSIAHLFDCKICKDVTSNPVYVTCCKQIFGCRSCYESCMATNSTCPLCRNQQPECLDVNGLDSVLEAVKGTPLLSRDDSD